MPCPFPGMDPYIEPSGAWPDFYASLIFCLRADLNRALRPRYAAVSERRLVVVEQEDGFVPDVVVLEEPHGGRRGAAAVLEADPAIVLEAKRAPEFMRQLYLQIVDPKAGGRVITTIEVVSPSNKTLRGFGAYRGKLDECLEAGVNVVEIDLIKEGQSILRPEFAAKLPPDPSPYVVAVSRGTPSQYEVYRVPLAGRLPRVAVPLAEGDQDVVVDLQAAFTAAWESGAYPALLHYNRPLPGDWTDADRAWCRDRLTAAGLAPAG